MLVSATVSSGALLSRDQTSITPPPPPPPPPTPPSPVGWSLSLSEIGPRPSPHFVYNFADLLAIVLSFFPFLYVYFFLFLVEKEHPFSWKEKEKALRSCSHYAFPLSARSAGEQPRTVDLIGSAAVWAIRDRPAVQRLGPCVSGAVVGPVGPVSEPVRTVWAVSALWRWRIPSVEAGEDGVGCERAVAAAYTECRGRCGRCRSVSARCWWRFTQSVAVGRSAALGGADGYGGSAPHNRRRATQLLDGWPTASARALGSLQSAR